MDAGRLKQLLVLDEALTEYANSLGQYAHLNQWVFRPAGPHRGRLFFLWIDDNRKLGGTRCRDVPSDRAEPWQWHAFLPQKFLESMLDMAPPEQVAAAIARHLTN